MLFRFAWRQSLSVVVAGISVATAGAQQPIWTLAGSPVAVRMQTSVTLLASGKVLSAGGFATCSPSCVSSNGAELYDPASRAWSQAASMRTPRTNHIAVRLPNGKVLVAGGYVSPGVLTAASELYDPDTGAWSDTGSLALARQFHQAVLLPSGKVLVMGGLTASGRTFVPTFTAELYDPQAGVWSATGGMTVPRFFHSTTLLSNGNVLVAGGSEANGAAFKAVRSAELYDPAAGNWTVTGQLSTAREEHTATLLPGGKVLAAGGLVDGENGTVSADLYDPATGQWTAAASMRVARGAHTATLLPSGKALVAGGGSGPRILKDAELFDPVGGSWSPATELRDARAAHSAMLLHNGKVLVSSGIGADGESSAATTEVFGIPEPRAGSIVTVSGASFFDNGTLAPDSFAAAFGTGLASTTQTAASLPWPQTLAGVSVKVRDSAGMERPAPVYSVSPGQINYVVPTGTTAGMATVTVNRDGALLASGDALVTAVAPGLFSSDSTGQGLAAAAAVRVAAGGAQSVQPVARFDSNQNRFVAVPVDVGVETDQVILLLYGTGIRSRGALSSVTATIGAVPADVLFAGASPEFPAVDQVNVRVPRSLAGRGEVDLTLSSDGRAANTLRIAFR